VIKTVIRSGLFLGVTALGFAAGFALGQRTRTSTESNTEVSFSGGVVTVRSDVGRSVKQGASQLLYDWLGG
jgi:uncharacterized protein involved in exopolysaccharide biosynthesis